MRLPKFRCKNKVGNWCFFTVLHNGNVDEENFDLETLSEFTGLLDKQGVEICEGDIVKCFGDIAKVVWDNNDALYRYVYNNGGERYMEILGTHSYEHFEVIGNIYEQSNLLGENIEQN